MVKAAIKRPWIKGNAASPSHLQKLIVVQGGRGTLDHWSRIVKTIKQHLLQTNSGGKENPQILILTYLPSSVLTGTVPVIFQSGLLTAQIDRHHNMVHQFLLSKPYFLRIIHIEKRANILLEIAKKLYICIILFNDKMISLMVHGRIKVVSIIGENVNIIVMMQSLGWMDFFFKTIEINWYMYILLLSFLLLQ